MVKRWRSSPDAAAPYPGYALGSLNRDGQRLQDALSESVTFHLPGGGTETRLVASSSRLIAMIGLVSILALFLACGCVLIWTLGTCNHLPDNLNDMVNYILSGASLFVPYGVNQLRRAASALGNPSP